MHDVFISYSFADQADAEYVVNTLTTKYGVSCWICTRDIAKGANFKAEIEDAIVNSHVVVFIQSKNAVESDQIPKEIGIALEEERKIIPFKIDSAKLKGGLRYDLMGVEYIDATIPTKEQRIFELAKSISDVIGRPFLTDEAVVSRSSAIRSCNIPCSKIFAGRDRLMEDIHKEFEEGNLVFLHGMGGIGKSELACQYWKKYKDFYESVVFARYDGSLVSLLADDKVFGIDGVVRQTNDENEVQTDKEYARVKLDFLRKTADEHTLVIIDNFDVAVKEDKFFTEFVSDMKCRILVTTRCEPDRSLYQVLSVGEIDDEALKDLFMQYANPKKSIIERDDPEFSELFRLTNRHTYTLELVARFMEEEDEIDELSEIIAFLKKHGFGSVKVDGRDNICKLFRFTSLNDAEKYFLRCLALMPPAGVNQRLFKKWIGSGFSSRSHLVDRSLVKVNGETRMISLHPVVREVVISELKPSYENCKEFLDSFTEELYDYISWNYSIEHKKFLFECCKNISEQLVTVNKESFELFFHMANFSCFVDSFSNNVDRLESLLLKAVEILGKDSSVEAKILHRIGWCYLSHGCNHEALEIFLNRAMPVLEKQKLSAPGEYIHCCCDIAKLFCRDLIDEDENNMALGFEYLEKAKKMVFDPDLESKYEIVKYRQMLVCASLSTCFHAAGDLDKAEYYALKGYDVSTSLEHTELDQSHMLCRIADIRKERKDFPEVIKLLTRSLELLEKHSGMLNTHSTQGKSHCTRNYELSECYEQVGDIEAAKAAICEAYKIAEKIFQQGNPVLAKVKERYGKFFG